MKRLSSNKRHISKQSKDYFQKQINNIIYVLVILLVVLVIRLINTNTTNRIIKIIEENINYKFSLAEDGEKAKNYLIKSADNSKNTIDKLTKSIIKKASKKQ